MAESTRRVFQKRSIMKTTLDRMIAFHEDPAALRRLTPPPIFVQLHEDTRTALNHGDVVFTLWFAVIPLKWHVRHEELPAGQVGFADRLLKGPLAYWRHEHIFTPVEGGVELTDRVTLEHKPGLPGLLTRLAFDGLPLAFLFFYRHLMTRRAVEK